MNPLTDLRKVFDAELMQNPLSAAVAEKSDIIIIILNQNGQVSPAI